MIRAFLSPVSLIVFAVLAAGVALLAGAPLEAAAGSGMALALAGATAAPEGPARFAEDLPAFDNVVATGRASTEIPRWAATLLSVQLKLGGTTFNESHITEVRLKLGPKTIWFATGSHLRTMNAYKGYYTGNRQFLWVDFTAKGSKDMGGQFVGGIDMATIGPGKLMLEVVTSGATAPTLSGKARWGRPQGNDLLQKLLQFPWASGGTGRRVIPLYFSGAMVRRLFLLQSGTDFASSAAATAWSGNTGNGAMGAITVSAGAKPGTHKIVIAEPGSNVGTFIHQDPDGLLVSAKGVVASAYSGGGLAFTLADGGTDFVSGDGFDIVVSENTNGNMSRVEVKKDGRAVWDYECAEARQLQRDYGYKPQSQCYVVDFEADGWPDGALRTDDATTLEFAAHMTASDASVTIYAELLDRPGNN